MKRTITPEQALDRLEVLCSRSEQSTFDVTAKMRRWGLDPDDIRTIVDSLTERRFVDDARFASAFVREKILISRWGKLKVGMLLRARGMDFDVVDDALSQIDDEAYRSIAVSVMRSRVRQRHIAPDDFDGKRKLYSFSTTRGFEARMVSEIIRSGLLWAEDE